MSKSKSVLASQQVAYDYIFKSFEIFMKSSQSILPHFIMSGETGSGKSMLIELLAKKFNIKCLSLNGAQLTPEGIQGASLSKLLVPLEKVQNKPCIVLIDEFDKLFTDSKEKVGVQQEILHMLSSRTAKVIGQYGHYDTLKLDKVLFIFAGAFQNRTSVTPQFLLEYGMEPELLGRVNLHIHVPSVEVNELLEAVDKEVLFNMYQEVLELSDKDIVAAKESVKARISEIWSHSVIGYRVIQRVIHQYFLHNGEYPPETEDDSIESSDDDFKDFDTE